MTPTLVFHCSTWPPEGGKAKLVQGVFIVRGCVPSLLHHRIWNRGSYFVHATHSPGQLTETQKLVLGPPPLKNKTLNQRWTFCWFLMSKCVPSFVVASVHDEFEQCIMYWTWSLYKYTQVSVCLWYSSRERSVSSCLLVCGIIHSTQLHVQRLTPHGAQ